MGLLARVNSPADIRQMSLAELSALAQEIRALIISVTSQTGGHVASSLGTVELTLALHRVFQTPLDCIVWDVGHQSYAHKIITGRRDLFHTLRQKGGIAGFPKRAESEFDVFDTGHSGDSISVALGLTTGYRRLSKPRRCVAVIGDGSVATGMAFEALNHAGAMKADLVVVLNDNEMSIGKSTGALAGYLSRIITGRMYNRIRADAWELLGYLPGHMGSRARKAARKLEEALKNLLVPSLLFEELGFRYIGPLDGHNIGNLVATFQRVREMHGPVLVHVATVKGRGYEPAVRDPERFHGTPPFNPQTGESIATGTSFTAAFGEHLLRLAEADERIVAITAGMCLGTGLVPFRERFPDRLFDVGICEQHAVTFASGLAQAGLRPVVAIYSTFLMRAVDQIAVDVCLQGLPVVFAVDRAGLVGEDGSTHHGVFDIAYLSMLPGIVLMAPRDGRVLGSMLEFALRHTEGPIAMRFPRASGEAADTGPAQSVEIGRAEVMREGKDGCIFSVGSLVYSALEAADLLAREGIELTVVDLRFIKPLDCDLILKLARQTRRIFTLEEGSVIGGVGAAISSLLSEHRLGAAFQRRLGIPDTFVEHGSRPALLDSVGLSTAGVVRTLREAYGL